MQPISLNSSSKSQASTLSSASNMVESEIEENESLQNGGELKERFSAALGTAIAEKGKGENTLDNEDGETAEQFDAGKAITDEIGTHGDISEGQSELKLAEQKKEDDNDDDDLSLDNAQIEVANVDTHMPDSGVPLLAGKRDDEKQGEASEYDDQDGVRQLEKGENNPSILAQIEAAQKIDTQVTESQKAASLKEEAQLLGPLKQGQTSTEQLKMSVTAADATLKTDSKSLLKKENTTLSKDFSADIAQQTDKINSSLSTAAVAENLTAHGVDHAQPRSVNLSSVNSGQVTQDIQTSTSSLLQQPLDMQAKHASALLGERVLMMIKEGRQEIQIRLDPAELGSMHIKLHVQQDQVQLAIHTQQGESRDLIEQNLPKLREQLAQQGINLGDASVEQHAQQQNSNQQGKNNGLSDSSLSAEESILPSLDDKIGWRAAQIVLSEQGIDYYA